MGLTVADFGPEFTVVHARRTIVQTNKANTGNGTPFAWKEYPKGRRPRRLALTPEAGDVAKRLIDEQNLGPTDRLFCMPAVPPVYRRVKIDLSAATLAELGTFDGVNGKPYRHGTINGYTSGRCRCPYCKQAASDYRYQRLHPPESTTVPRNLRTEMWPDGLPVDRSYFRERVWRPTLAKAQLPLRRFHDLRASHISWLLAMGVDLPTVMERVGHREFETTMRYTRTLSAADEKVLQAMRQIRRRD